MTRMTGGEAIAGALRAHGIEVVFGLPGAQVYGLFDAFHRAEGLRLIGARHEQACGYMAFGYARSTGRPGVFAVVPGPGMLNTAAALVTALGGNEPVLCLTGQVPTAFLGLGRGHLHEMPDQLATLRGFTKWAARIEAPALVPQILARAFQEMGSHRRGPAAVEMPWDQFTAITEVVGTEPLAALPAPVPDEDRIADAARLVGAARAPMIFVGSGAFGAAREIEALAERIGAPVVPFRSGRGIVPEDRELGLNVASGGRLWPETDLAIGIGTRMELAAWRWRFVPEGLKTIRIDIDPAEFRRSPADVAILADARAGTAALLAALERSGLSSRGRRGAIAEAKAWAAEAVRAVEPHAAYLAAIRDVLPRDGILVDEMCQAGFASWFAFPVLAPRTFISSGYQGTLGSGFPTALGVKVAHPDRAVVSITGDGGFLFAVQELATAVQYGIGVVAVVFNNDAYGNVRRDQLRQFGGRLSGSELVNPDFGKLADAFGVGYAKVSDPAALRRALEAALADGGCWLVEVPVDPDREASPWPFISPDPPRRG